MIGTILPKPTLAVGLASHLKRNPLPDPGAISRDDLAVARTTWGEIQREHGFLGTGTSALLTPPDANTKIKKSAALVWSLTLAPAMSSGMINTCVRYADCHDVCVLTSGKGGVPAVQRSRAARTGLLYRAPHAFAVLLAAEIDRAAYKALREGREWRVRLNAASDIPWEVAAPWLLQHIADNSGRAYDYTKSWARPDVPGYTLCRSVDSRQSVEKIRATVNSGHNVAVILPIAKGQPTPDVWEGMPAVDGDVSDDRSVDPRGVVVILRAKGTLRNRPAHPMMRAVSAPQYVEVNGYRVLPGSIAEAMLRH